MLDLLTKHPQIVEELEPMTSPSAFQAKTEEVEAAIRSFKHGSAPGGSGLRADHLKDLLKSEDPIAKERFLTTLTRFCNSLLNKLATVGMHR